MALTNSWLHSDLMWEILTYLPPRSLLRFREVSKSWREVIDSPRFRKKQVQNQISNCRNGDSVFLMQLFNEFDSRTLLMSSIPVDRGILQLADCLGNVKVEESTKVVGAVNGLICIYSQHVKSYEHSSSVTICNQSLNIMRELPTSPSRFKVVPHYRMLGIYFDKNDAQDYKVVQLVQHCIEGRVLAEIYSKRTNSWRVLGNIGYDHHRVSIFRSVNSSAKNASFLHWEAYRGSSTYDGPTERVLLTFDVMTEEFEMYPMRDFPRFNLLGDSLKMFAGNDDASTLLLFNDDTVSTFHPMSRYDWLSMYEGKRDGDAFQWNFVRDLGPFRRHTELITLYKRDFIILKHCSGESLVTFSLYNFRAGKFAGCFRLPKYYAMACSGFEYQGSFVTP